MTADAQSPCWPALLERLLAGEALSTDAATGLMRGWLAEEIVPVPVKAGRETRVVDRDEHPRPGTALDDLARLKPLLGPGTTITAGNASGINDGAGALLLASEAAAA